MLIVDHRAARKPTSEHSRNAEDPVFCEESIFVRATHGDYFRDARQKDRWSIDSKTGVIKARTGAGVLLC